MWRLAIFLSVILLIPSGALRAQTPPPKDPAALNSDIERLRRDLDEQKKAYDERLKALDDKITALSLEGAAPTPAPASGFAANVSRVIQSMNPDISVVGDFLAYYDTRGDKADPGNDVSLREVEIGVTGDIDPYAKGTLIVAMEKNGSSYETSVEEGYAFFPNLPWDLQLKVGRFRPELGKVNTLHMHSLPWVEYPLVTQRFLGDEGMVADGVSVSRLIPNPWDAYVELTYQAFRNDNDVLFAGSQARDVAQLVHLKSFFDLSPSSTLEVGLSAATAPNNANHGGQRTNVGGADVTFKWRPPEAGKYESVTIQGEALMTRKDLQDSESRQDAWGMYSAVEYQFAERWSVGGRYDYTEDPNTAGQREYAGSVYLTFRQSEFCFWRLGYQQLWSNAESDNADTSGRVWLQLNFSFGVHGTHKY